MEAKGGLVVAHIPYWSSVPLPIQMMGSGYIAWRRAEKARRRREEPTLRRSQRDRLEAPKTWPHPQLRVLSKIASPSRLALPWVAPSLPWWDLHGAWSEPGASGGKLLIFTRFKAVPPALASLLSFDLEASFAHRLRRNYRRAGEAQPLQFKEGRTPLPALFFPSPTLIAFVDPRRDKTGNLAEVRNSMRRQVGRRVVALDDGSILNRYWDDSNAPRDESYREDIAQAQATSREPLQVYREIRAAAESGWDISSRWFADFANARCNGYNRDYSGRPKQRVHDVSAAILYPLFTQVASQDA